MAMLQASIVEHISVLEIDIHGVSLNWYPQTFPKYKITLQHSTLRGVQDQFTWDLVLRKFGGLLVNCCQLKVGRRVHSAPILKYSFWMTL